MNRMNIPPPFEGLNEDPIVKEAYDFENYQDLFGFRKEHSANTSNGIKYNLSVIDN